jgi:hypothetical protein
VDQAGGQTAKLLNSTGKLLPVPEKYELSIVISF